MTRVEEVYPGSATIKNSKNEEVSLHLLVRTTMTYFRRNTDHRPRSKEDVRIFLDLEPNVPEESDRELLINAVWLQLVAEGLVRSPN